MILLWWRSGSSPPPPPPTPSRVGYAPPIDLHRRRYVYDVTPANRLQRVPQPDAPERPRTTRIVVETQPTEAAARSVAREIAELVKRSPPVQRPSWIWVRQQVETAAAWSAAQERRRAEEEELRIVLAVLEQLGELTDRRRTDRRAG
jgi:hypothetical protein